MNSNLSLAQKILLFSLCGLIMLMIIFSVGAIKNTGKKGYEKCHQEKCDSHGEAWCNKYREISNCCLGAGGQLAMASNNKLECIFT